MLSNTVSLIGFMGSGKTTVGKVIASTLRCSLKDTDEMVIARAKRSIPKIFAEDGEQVFRQLESRAIWQLSQVPKPVVIATGGGVVEDSTNMLALRQLGKAIYLLADFEVVKERLQADNNRPLLTKNNDKLLAFYHKRHQLYLRFADHVVNANNSVERVAQEVLRYVSGRH